MHIAQIDRGTQSKWSDTRITNPRSASYPSETQLNFSALPWFPQFVKGLSTVRVAMLRFLLPRLARPRRHEPPVCCILDSNVLGIRALDRIRNQRARRFLKMVEKPAHPEFSLPDPRYRHQHLAINWLAPTETIQSRFKPTSSFQFLTR